MLRWFFQVCNRQPSWNAQKEWSMWYWTFWIILRCSKSVFPYSGILSQTIPLRIQSSRKVSQTNLYLKRKLLLEVLTKQINDKCHKVRGAFLAMTILEQIFVGEPHAPSELPLMFGVETVGGFRSLACLHACNRSLDCKLEGICGLKQIPSLKLAQFALKICHPKREVVFQATIIFWEAMLNLAGVTKPIIDG